MNFLTLCGSIRTDSKTFQLLDFISAISPEDHFTNFNLSELPSFNPDFKNGPTATQVEELKKSVLEATGIIIATPEYLHNIPSVLKSALEWLTEGGEIKGKRVLPITYTPHPPRGAKAMQSLLWTLKALEAQIIGSLELYHTEISFDDQGDLLVDEGVIILKEAMSLFKT